MPVKIIDDRIPGADELEVGFVRVGNKDERILPLQFLKQTFGNKEPGEKYRGPDLAKFGKVHFQSRSFAQVGVELAGRDLTPFVALDPVFVPQNFLETSTGDRACAVQGLDAGLEVEVDQDLTEIEQNCFNLHT
jgi:hypothetical protein